MEVAERGSWRRVRLRDGCPVIEASSAVSESGHHDWRTGRTTATPAVAKNDGLSTHTTDTRPIRIGRLIAFLPVSHGSSSLLLAAMQRLTQCMA